MTLLNQILAVEKGVKSATTREFTDIHRTLGKPAMLQGITRDYKPRDEEGEQIPSERTKVQLSAEKILDTVADALSRLFDVTATKDYGNQIARADVVVDGNVLVEDAPVPYLLFLEKQLNDLHTFVTKLPVLDPAEAWVYDENSGAFRTEVSQTVRTKKVPKNHVKAEATDRHPAQVELYYEDVTVGYWSTVKFSGALPAVKVRDLVSRVEKLQQAVKFAREEANGTEVENKVVGEKIFDYLFRA